MQNFQDTFETPKQSFISAFLIYKTALLNYRFTRIMKDFCYDFFIIKQYVNQARN